MKNLHLNKIFLVSCSLITDSWLLARRAYAQNEIVNEAIKTVITANPTPGAGLAFYIAQLWKTIIIVGGLAFLLYMVWGGIEYMMAGSDKGKVEEAQHKITNSLIGLAILVASFAISFFIGAAFKINLLAPSFPTNY